MERIAIVENDKIVNIVNAPADWVDPQKRELTSAPRGSGAEIGSERQPDGSWKMPEKSVEEKRKKAKLSRAEFKLALLERDELDAVKQAMSDPSSDPRAVILWEDANEFRRTNKDLLALAAELGYTEEQLDDIFGINS